MRERLLWYPFGRLFATGVGNDAAAGNVAMGSATFDGVPAAVMAVSPSTSNPPGYFEIDVQVPAGLPQSDFVLVQVQISGVASQDGTTISIR
jgi:uncharacterized protein (TIGR03437 family)